MEDGGCRIKGKRWPEQLLVGEVPATLDGGIEGVGQRGEGDRGQGGGRMGSWKWK
jgi:hypothetical protein